MRFINLVLVLAITLLSATAFAKSRWIDLTHTFDQETIYWPTANSFTLKTVHKGKTKGGYWYETNDMAVSEHGGTHMDAPVHFAKGKWSAEKVPLTSLMGPACVLDVSQKSKKNRDYLVSVEDIEEWEKQHGPVPTNSIFLAHTGWDEFWPNKKHYLGTKEKGDVANLHFPGFSKEAADLLVKRGVKAVGLDTPSLDFGQSKDYWAHRIFGKANIPGFENVANLHDLPATGATVIALPMKIGDGSGGPLRIIAQLP